MILPYLTHDMFSCYDMLCYDMLCYDILCYDMLCYDIFSDNLEEEPEIQSRSQV